MKDARGFHSSAVRNAIFKTFGLQLSSSKRKNSKDVLEWKRSKEVVDRYNQIYSDTAAIENISIMAFPSLANAGNEIFNDMYAYTASVCDIVLNPNYPTLELSKKALELRFQRFKVLFIELLLFLLFKLNLLIKIKN